ncbi:MAG: PLP-dependent transferase [Opitutales bacterium]|nr:PLP-dependent transferase [Opitutales bacterium]
MDAIKHFPLGHTINNSPHSICISLPTMADLIGYEKADPEIMRQIASGYPRFVRNPLIRKLADQVERSQNLSGRVFFTTTDRAAAQLLEWVGAGALLEGFACSGAIIPPQEDLLKRAWKFLQHTGCGIGSRQAEDLLELCPTEEAVRTDDPEAHILQKLHSVYHTRSADDVALCSSGMNAFYTAFQAARTLRRKEGRTVWVQLGWLYADSTHILNNFLAPDEKFITIYDVSDTDAIENALQRYQGQIAGIVAEVPSNPLVHTPDVEAIKAIAKDHDAILLMDPTLVGALNVDILNWTDLLINSLTKYAAGKGDVIMGAVALNRRSKWYDLLKPLIQAYREKPYVRDIARLAYEIDDYEPLLRRINANAVEVSRFLRNHSAVKSVNWVYSEETGRHFTRIANGETANGSVISFSLNIPLDRFYDRVQLVKSPSFGLEFTLLCPFFYLANFDMVSTDEGREWFHMHGIDPDLIRLSVGTEDPARIIQALSEALS